MITNKIDSSTILVVDNIDSTLNDLVSFYPKHLVRIIKNEEKEEFLITQATLAIKEAYIA